MLSDSSKQLTMSKSSIQLRVDSDLKDAATALFQQLGLTLTEAITVFLKMSLNSDGLPFEVALKPNAETQKAFDEAEDIVRHPERYKQYENFEEVLQDVLGSPK